MDQLSFVLDSLFRTFSFIAGYWWLYLPVFLFAVLTGAFEFYTKLQYIKAINWVLLELKIPQDPGKSPKATEQIFTALHGILPPPIRWRDKFFKGKMVDWLSFEIVGINGEIHFYIRTPERYRKLVQSQIYSQYSDSEISEAVSDHADLLAPPDETHNLWGAEFILNKEDMYPIRTYPEFEEKSSGPDYVKRIDPIASLTEVMSSLEAGEYIGIQLLIQPTGEGWVKKGQTAVDKLQGKGVKSSDVTIFHKLIWEVDKLVPGYAEQEKKEEKKAEQLTSGKQEAIKSAERKFAKLGFNTGIRFIYAAPKETFHFPHVSGISGAFKQFTSQTSNGFKMNGATTTSGKGLRKAQKEYNKKIYLLDKYKNRSLPFMSFVLNTEELATVYHFPDIGVKSPLLPRIETKKGEPPVGLPIA